MSSVRTLLMIVLASSASVMSCIASEELVPAGSLLHCTISEPRFSSKTAAIGDPVLCSASPVLRFGHYQIPYGTYLQGRFEEYKDPGHFVGKGWMELRFDRLVLPQSQVVPLAAKVVAVPGMQVDRDGRILGKGHAVRDAVLWSIPILWPIDLLTLPARGPRPTLKSETQLTLKLMEDISLPIAAAATVIPTPGPYGFGVRPPVQSPMSYPAPVLPQYRVQQASLPAPAPEQDPLTVLILRDGNARTAQRYWLESGDTVVYLGENSVPVMIPLEYLNLSKTVAVNARRGVNFRLAVRGPY